MSLEEDFGLEHLLFQQRTCKVCGETKDLLSDFYLTRKDRGKVKSSYSYECKVCTIKRITNKRQQRKECQREAVNWQYPDW
jgi:hypothetical protein